MKKARRTKTVSTQKKSASVSAPKLYLYIKAECGSIAGTFPISKAQPVVDFMLQCVREASVVKSP